MTLCGEWQCGECGQWLDKSRDTHVHLKSRESTLDAMLSQRRMAEMLPGTPAFTEPVECTRYFRTGKEPTR